MGCTSKSSCEPFDPFGPAAGCVALHGAAFCGHVTEATRGCPSLTSHEVEHPSGDISCGVRITRVYLTRHLPPMSFLSPSTGFSSSRIACLISCRRHLWGSKNRNRLTGERPRSLQEPTRRPFPADRGTPRRRRQPKSTTTERLEASNNGTTSQPSLCLRGRRRRVTHHVPRKRVTWEEGAKTSLSSSSPTIREAEVSSRLRPTTLRPEPKRYNRVRKPNCRTVPVVPAFAA